LCLCLAGANDKLPDTDIAGYHKAVPDMEFLKRLEVMQSENDDAKRAILVAEMQTYLAKEHPGEGVFHQFYAMDLAIKEERLMTELVFPAIMIYSMVVGVDEVDHSPLYRALVRVDAGDTDLIAWLEECVIHASNRDIEIIRTAIYPAMVKQEVKNRERLAYLMLYKISFIDYDGPYTIKDLLDSKDDFRIPGSEAIKAAIRVPSDQNFREICNTKYPIDLLAGILAANNSNQGMAKELVQTAIRLPFPDCGPGDDVRYFRDFIRRNYEHQLKK